MKVVLPQKQTKKVCENETEWRQFLKATNGAQGAFQSATLKEKNPH